MDKIIRVVRARYADTDRSKDHNFDASPNNWLSHDETYFSLSLSVSCRMAFPDRGGEASGRCRSRCIGNGHHYQYLANRSGSSTTGAVSDGRRACAFQYCIYTRLFFTSRLARRNRRQSVRQRRKKRGRKRRWYPNKMHLMQKRSNTILL